MSAHATEQAYGLEARELVHGAFILGGPGTYVVEATDLLVIGNRPGIFHYLLVAASLPIALAVAWLLWSASAIAALAFLTLFGVVPLLTLLNTQRYEIRRGLLRARGKALGHARERDWRLPSDGAVRVSTQWETDGESAMRWPRYQAQVLTEDGWIGLAESAHAEPAEAFARRLAAAAGVPFTH